MDAPAIPTVATEKVLTAPTRSLQPYLKQGFFTSDRDAILLAIGKDACFIERPTAEDDPAYKQIIPYVAVVHEKKILAYRRTKKQGEARLHNKHSIGFGGHINDTDGIHPSQSNVLFSGMIRELNEELFLPDLIGLEMVGFLNDDSNPVGQVHLGFVFIARVGASEFQVNEPDLIEAFWMTPKEIAAIQDQFETWSSLLFDGLFRKD